jgi:hypothetical protein
MRRSTGTLQRLSLELNKKIGRRNSKACRSGKKPPRFRGQRQFQSQTADEMHGECERGVKVFNSSVENHVEKPF